MQRYESAKDELIYLLKTSWYNTAEMAYFVTLLPVIYIRADQQIYFDSSMLWVTTIFATALAFVLYLAHYLRMRAVELQFNAKMSGKWICIEEPKDASS